MEDVLKPPDPPDIWEVPMSPEVFPNSNSSQSSGTKRRSDGGDHASSSKKTITSTEMASASIQGLYCSNAMVIGFKAYSPSDKGPFLVHVSRSEPDQSAGTTIRPIKFGQFLVHNKVQNICPDGVKKVGRNKISVEFRTFADANNFLDNPILTMSKYEVTIPTYNITKMGIVRQVPVDLSMEEFANSLSVPNFCGEVLKARRLNRKTINEGVVTWVPTQTVVLTFHSQILPSKVYSFHTSLAVEAYQYPTIQCLSCCRFGHIKAQCRSSPRCFKCSQPHTGDSCDVIEGKATCLHCSGQHFASSKTCPEQGRQRSIKLLMSQEGISYEEASNRFPRVNRSYAEVAQEMFSPPSSVSYPSSSIPNSPASISSVSHKKTIFVPAVRQKKSSLGKAYDHQAHQSIVGNIPSSLPNGCALVNGSDVSQENGLLEILITLIINLLSQNKTHLPSNVAQQLMQIISLSCNNGSNVCSAVEQSKSTQEKI